MTHGVTERFHTGGNAPPDEVFAGIDVGEHTQHGAVGCGADVDETGPLALRQELACAVDHGIAEEKPGDERKDGVCQNPVLRQKNGEAFNSLCAHQETDGVENHQQDHDGRQNAGDIGDQILAAGCKHAGKSFCESDHKVMSSFS